MTGRCGSREERSLGGRSRYRHRHRSRAGAAALELALLLPVLCYIAVITVDYSRLFMAWITLAEAVYSGAYYESDSKVATNSGFSSYTVAVLADTGSLSPNPTISTGSGTDSSGNAYVTVTATWTFTTIFNYPGIPSSTTLTRTLQMAKTPS